MSGNKIKETHLARKAAVYIRQSTMAAVIQNVAGAERQYDMRERALALGWTADQVSVIDKDRGISGTSTYGRDGFKELLSEIIGGRIGAIFCVEVSRLARDSNDFQHLLKACALADTLIIDATSIYDLNNDDDCLVLGMKGTFSAVEQRLIRGRLLGAKLLLAKKGKLRLPLPIGYVYDLTGQLVLDPDEEVQKAVRLVFRLFDERGSAAAVLKYFVESKLLFPKRSGGGHDGDVGWVKLSIRRLISILHNPAYAGTYAYGRTKSRKLLVSPESLETKRVSRRAKFGEWTVCIHDHHVGYITWAQYTRIQERLLANVYWFERARHGAPRVGAALLQGLVICGRCGRRMFVHYPSRKRQGKAARYFCRHRQETSGIKVCQSLPNQIVDRAVTEQLLKAIEPAQLEMSLEMWQQFQSQAHLADQQWRLRLERAEHEAELARRRFMQVDPERRRVARHLEQEWDAKLNQLERLQLEYVEVKNQRPISISSEERKLLLSLAQDFPKVWYSGSTTHEQRKRLLRQLITDVTLTRAGSAIHINILWRTQAQTDLDVNINGYSELISLTRRLASDHTDRAIAEYLNRLGVVNRLGNPYRTNNITVLRKRHSIPLTCRESQVRYPSGQRSDGLYTPWKVAELVGVDISTVYKWMRTGRLEFTKSGRNKWIRLTPDKMSELNNRRIKVRHPDITTEESPGLLSTAVVDVYTP